VTCKCHLVMCIGFKEHVRAGFKRLIAVVTSVAECLWLTALRPHFDTNKSCDLGQVLAL
jgi:hypothetical protein